jgi:hypothetical protein
MDEEAPADYPSPPMHLSLSPEEFNRLLLLATLGEVVVNDWTTEERQSQEQRACTDLLGDLYQHAVDRGGLAVRDTQTGELMASDELRRRVDEWLGAYDEDVFWDELVLRFAHRELAKEYGVEGLEKMPPIYREGALRALREYFWKEVRQHGIERLQFAEEARKITPAPSRSRRPKRSQPQKGDAS